MYRTSQDAYALNLLRAQKIGYPLRNPSPDDKLGDQGVQIGDVGYVGCHGEFNRIFNIISPPEECEKFPIDQPINKVKFSPGDVLMAGVEQVLGEKEPDPSIDYLFNTTSEHGAILVLPDGAFRAELEDPEQLAEIRKHATKWALRWSKYTNKSTLYLVTAVHKSKSWTLGSFINWPTDGTVRTISVRQHNAANDPNVYKWRYTFNVEHEEGPVNNPYINQTILIKGFKITMKRGWVRIDEWLERTNWWFACVLARLCSAISRQLLISVEDIMPPLLSVNFSQPYHPLDIINSVLLEKNRRAPLAITHDNDWIKMVERGLPHADLLHEDRVRKFVVEDHMWESDSNNNAVYLRNSLMDDNGGREPTQDPSSPSEGNTPRVVIKNMRLESVGIDHMYAGVCILIQFGSTTRRTQNKPYAGVVEWDDEITLPSDLSVNVAVCGAFQIGSTLGIREISTKQTINTTGLSGGIHVISLSVGEAKPCSSLLITLGRHFSHFEPLSSHEVTLEFVEKTNLAFEALHSYYDDPKEEHLERAHDSFEDTLRCPSDSTLHATALFNVATLKLIRCQARGIYSEINAPIELYERALKLRGPGHPDRPGTLLLLAQALLSRLGQEYEDSTAEQIMDLMAEISSDNDRDRRTADAILHTRRFYEAISYKNASEVDCLLEDLDCGKYVPPYGYFDKPRTLHKLGVALWKRFHRNSEARDLDKSIELNEEALALIPDGHDDKASIVDCLGRSYVKRIEIGLVDVDMLVDLVDLGESVISALGDISPIEGAGGTEAIHEQIALISAADTALHCIEEEVPPPRIPAIQDLIDEWNKGDGVPVKCKRQLGVLLSFLCGEGETRMRESLAKVDWPFKEYKTKETISALQDDIPYFQCPFANRLRV